MQLVTNVTKYLEERRFSNNNLSAVVPVIFRKFAYMKEPRVYNGIERPEFTPERISELKADEVFVFGSNLEGMHGGGAAWVAFQKFGAVLGCGVGLRGQSYAIPTMQGGVETIKPYVDEFVAFAREHPELFFYVTRIGCGIAGFKEKEIAPLFADAPGLENVCLPEGFAKILK
jgi:hypothetical protein